MAYQQPYQPPHYNGGYAPQYQNGAILDTLSQYKGQYQMPPVQQPLQQPVPQQAPMQIPTPSNDLIWVLSEGEAQSYPVAPNNSVILWDKNNDVVYIKSVNAQNIPSFRVLDYKERTADNASNKPVESNCKCGSKFVSNEDFKALKCDFEALREELEELKAKPKSKTTKKVVEEATDGE